MVTSSDPKDVRRRAGWLPDQQEDLEDWLTRHRERAEARGGDAALHPTVAEFQQLIEGDPLLRMYADQMVAQVPAGKSYSRRQITSVTQLLRLMNEVLTMAPEFSSDSMVMTPLGAVLDWTSGTRAGFAFYRDPRVNAALKKMLGAWCDFLTSADSLSVLNDSPSGWQSPDAQRTVGMEQFEYDPDAPHWGFTSWNDFFTRRFKEHERPVAAPDDDSVIVSACESTPYGISTDVQLQDRFWIKSQPYSLKDMLADDPVAQDLVGGTVYQAFLSATNYHRWHSPVAGTVVRAFVQDGTYYSEADAEGPDAIEPADSQSYLAHVATRAIIVIDADNPAIGLMAFVAVGMVDVSSCVLDPKLKRRHHVAKGDELGYFQFGGSTHCLVFRPGAIADFALDAVPQPHDPDAPLVHVRSKIAAAAPRS